MAMSVETIPASGQHNAHQKFKCRQGAGGYGLSAGNCGGDNGLGRYKVQGKSTACKHFSIRGFVARTREIDTKTCWPFPQHLLETRLKDGCDPVLPPLDIPEYRWWNCQKCTSSLNTAAESSVEKKDLNNLQEPLQEYDGYCESSTCKLHSDRSASSVYECQKSVSNGNMREMYKENQLDHRQLLECLTIELKPSDENSSADELISHKKAEQMVTNEITDQTRIESIVPTGLEMHNIENLDSGEKKREALLHSSDFANSKGNINVTESFHHVREEEIAYAGTGQLTLQKMVSELQKDTDEKIDSIGNKAEIVSELQKETDDKIVSIENKVEILSDVSRPSNSWECFSRDKNIFEEICNIVRGKEMQAATSQILPLDSKSSEADDSGLDVNKKENVNRAHISYGENICLGQHIFAENQMGKETIPGTMPESVAVERVELSIDNRDHIHLASEEKKDVTSVNMNGNESSCHAHIKTNFSNQRKDRVNHCTDQAPLEQVNALLLEETEKLKDNESKHKRRSQKKRSLSDIIASEPFLPESLYKETEQSIRADIMEEYSQGVENSAQFPVQTNNVKRQKEAEQRLCKSRVRRNGLPEIKINNIDPHNIIQGKGRPEKLEVRKKRRGLGAQFWNSNLLHFAKDSLDSCNCDTVKDNNQVPRDASEMWRSSKDKSPGEVSFHLENGQGKQKGMELDDEIPMDIVELMAKNQHERGLSKPVNIYESHNIQTDKSLMKMKAKETDFSHLTEILDKERISHKNDSGIANKVVQLGQSNQANSRAYLTRPTGIKEFDDTSRIHVSETTPKRRSVTSGTKGMESVSSQCHSSMLQSPQLFNPWKSCCSGFATSVFGGTNAVSNPPIPVVHSTKPHAVLTHCDRNGHFYMNGRQLPAVQCQEATVDGRHKQMQNLCREASSALSDLTNPELSKFQNKSKSAVNHHWTSSLLNSQERLIKAEILSKLMSSSNSDLEITGSVFDFLNQNLKEKDVSKQPSRTDPAFCPAFLVGQNKLGVMQQGNVQTPTFGNEHISSASVLRLMGQCVSVPNGFGNGKNMETGNQDYRNCYKLYQGSSEKHISWVHAIPCVPSGEVERNEKERLSKAGMVFKGSTPAQGSMHMNNQTLNPSQTVPPVPKFRAFEPLVLNGRPQIQGISCTFPVKTIDAVQSSMGNTRSPLSSTLLLGIKQDGLQYSNVINAYHNESENPSTLPLIAQITDSVKVLSSPTKGLRSCRRLPTNVRSRRHHRSALDIYLEKRFQRLQSSWDSGTTDPNQSSAEEAGKTETRPELILNRESQVSSSYSEEGACNTEICTLNQNPAEINLDDGEENRGIFGSEDSSHHVGLAEKLPRNKCSPARAQKHRKTLKIRQLRGFFAQNTDNVGASINRNDGMAAAWTDRSTIQQVRGIGVGGTYAPQK